MKTLRRISPLALALLVFTFCTPTEQQAAVKAVDDAVKCIGANLDKTPGQIALTCGIEETPDLVALVQAIASGKARANCTTVTTNVDAGAKGPGL